MSGGKAIQHNIYFTGMISAGDLKAGKLLLLCSRTTAETGLTGIHPLLMLLFNQTDSFHRSVLWDLHCNHLN